jgi:hypothetical protein
VEFAKALADRVGISLDETLLWNFPTIDSLLTYLENPQGKSVSPATGASQAAAPESSPGGGSSSIEDEFARLERELKRRS